MSGETSEYSVVLTTVPSEEVADAIAFTLVGSKLAACASVFPVRSIYTWRGEVCRDSEVQLLIKTKRDRLEELTTKINELHPYELPEIVALPIVAGLPDYLSWIGEVTQ